MRASILSSLNSAAPPHRFALHRRRRDSIAPLLSPASGRYPHIAFMLRIVARGSQRQTTGGVRHPRSQPSGDPRDDVAQHLLALGLVEDLVIQAVIHLQLDVGG